MRNFLLSICLFAIVNLGYSQKLSQQNTQTQESLKGKHQLQFMLGHSLITETFNDGKKDWMAVPSFALDYHYWLSDRLALGLHNDVIAANFLVESEHGALLERHRPIASILSMVYKPSLHNNFILGFGQEFSRDQYFSITRLGYEYAIALPKHAELNFGINYDIKWKAYDVVTVGIGISKLF